MNKLAHIYVMTQNKPLNTESELFPGVKLFNTVKAKQEGVVALLATMPKSGTWYNHYFFYFYHSLLSGKSASEIEMPIPDSYTKKVNCRMRETLGLSHLHVCHTTCPEYEGQLGELEEKWRALKFYVSGYEYGSTLIDDESYLFSPRYNENVRILYYFRNPLDQALSYFRHTRKHKDLRHWSYIDENNQQCFIYDMRTFLFSVGLDAYIKQYLTFKLVQKAYPDNVLMLPYEHLIAQPERIFEQVLNHFGHNIDLQGDRALFQQALQMSSRDNLSKLENKMGKAMAGDQADPNERHIRDGSAGKWREYISAEDICLVEERLNTFGLSLAEFVLD